MVEVGLHSTSRAANVALAATAGNGGHSDEGVILNRHSREVTQAQDKGGAQAMLHGAGLSIEDLDKAQVGISSVWWEGMTMW
jgi:hypothetical protein